MLTAIEPIFLLRSRAVVATTSTKEKIDWLLNLPSGATHAANYKTQDFAAVVKEVTDNRGADVVIDFVGRTHFQKNVDAMAIDGRMTILSLLSGKCRLQLNNWKNVFYDSRI